jgi:hypothetical protein
MIVELDDDEISLAETIGNSRHTTCETKQYKNYKKSTIHNDKELDVMGVFGEMAVAKGFNCLEEYVEDCIENTGWTLKDVGRVQVRTTPVPNGRLIVRPGDGRGMDGEKLKEPFVLVIQLSKNKYKLAGWMIGKEAIQQRYEFDPYGKGMAYFVPQKDLIPMDKLNPSYFTA